MFSPFFEAQRLPVRALQTDAGLIPVCFNVIITSEKAPADARARGRLPRPQGRGAETGSSELLKTTQRRRGPARS